MQSITIKKSNDQGYLTLEFLVDDNPIDVKVRTRNRPEKTWLIIDQIQVEISDAFKANTIARAIATKISITEKK